MNIFLSPLTNNASSFFFCFDESKIYTYRCIKLVHTSPLNVVASWKMLSIGSYVPRVFLGDHREFESTELNYDLLVATFSRRDKKRKIKKNIYICVHQSFFSVFKNTCMKILYKMPWKSWVSRWKVSRRWRRKKWLPTRIKLDLAREGEA